MMWLMCDRHREYYPDTDICPICKNDLKEREKKALAVHWKDVIPFDKSVDFLRGEMVYCREQEREYDWYRNSDNNLEREHARIKLLEARAEFLFKYATTIIKMTEEDFNVYKSEDSD